MKSDKQAEVLKYLRGLKQATKIDIYQNVPFSYYNNWEKHFGALLSRMVKSNLINRVGRGVYSFKSNIKHQSLEQQDPNQLILFK